MKQNSYNIILSPMFHTGGFGANIKNKNGSCDIYSIQGPLSVEKGIPSFGDKDSFKYLAWHEFSHSFVNPLTEENLKEVEKYSKLYEPISKKMKDNAYPTWQICVNEHIVRSVTARLAYMRDGQDAYEKTIAQEKAKGFIYITQLTEKLEEYEKNRDQYNSLREFYPGRVKVFSLC